MAIDKETVPNYINVVMPDNKKFLDKMRKQADDDGQHYEEGCEKKLSFTIDNSSFQMEEYYFDDDGTIMISGNVSSVDGDSYFSVNIPLSDKVLIDILEYSTKKLNKLKTALETLK